MTTFDILITELARKHHLQVHRRPATIDVLYKIYREKSEYGFDFDYILYLTVHDNSSILARFWDKLGGFATVPGIIHLSSPDAIELLDTLLQKVT